MSRNPSSALLSAFQGLRISSFAAPSRCTASAILGASSSARPAQALLPAAIASVRPFSSTPANLGTWLEPFLDRKMRMHKGRPRVPTGGSVKGTTVVWGDYGLRMKDHDRRVSARNLKLAEEVIKRRLRGEKYRLYKRVACNIGVFYSGNEHRMGKGRGSFDHWAARIAVSQIVFEIRGVLHEQVIRDALRLAASKLPGQYEFVKKGEPPVVGKVKLDGVTLEELKQPWKKVPLDAVPPQPRIATATTPTSTKKTLP